jgi:diguanylate cyclase (GGDEF)-like protein/PAS domain S-box-containing protein
MRERLAVVVALLGVSLGPLLIFFLLQSPRLERLLTDDAVGRAVVAAAAEAATLRSRLDSLRVNAMLLAELAAPGRPEGRGRRLESAASRWLGGLPEVTAVRLLDAAGRSTLNLTPRVEGNATQFYSTPTDDSGIPQAAVVGPRVVPLDQGARLAITAPLPEASNGGSLAIVIDTALLTGELLETYWVTSDGQTLHQPVTDQSATSQTLPTLRPPTPSSPGIWHEAGRSVAWAALPMGATTSFIGREAALAPAAGWLAAFRSMFLATLGLALLPAVAMTWYLAGRSKNLRGRVVTGLKRLLDGEEVRFRWPGRGEFALLGQDLNGIAQRYRDSQAAQRKSQSDLATERDTLAATAQGASIRVKELNDRLSALPVAVLVVGEKGAIEDCNTSALEILGFSDRAALLGEDFHERLMHSRADGRPLPGRLNPVKLAAEGKAPEHPVEAVLWRADANAVPVAISASVLPGGTPRKLMVTFRDLREESRRSMRLAGERQQLEQTLAALPDAVLTLDTEGTVIRTNPETEYLTGWPANEAQGQPVDEVVRLDGMTVLEALASEKSGSAHLEALLERREGGHAYVRCLASPLLDAEGARQGAVVVLRDLTGSPPRAHEPGYQSSHDVLTGLMNRPEVELRLQRVLERAWKSNEFHAICYLDLDGFGDINQRLGSVAGDVLLRQVGSLLRSGIRTRDAVARVGADEFAVLLEHCTSDQAMRVASTLREAIRDFHFHWGEHTQELSASVGLVQLPAEIRNAEAALAAGESACIRAKDRGGNRVELGGAEDARNRLEGAAHWVRKLNKAMEENRFRLFCQSIVPLRGRSAEEASHYELLLRMVDEAGNLAPASAFLPMAARYNMISTTDRWVTRTALEWLATCSDSAETMLLEINLAEATIADDSFPEHVKALLDETSVPAAWVCFQFSAAAAKSRPGDAARLCRALKKLGCMVAIDDFGAECSSYAQLRELRVDFIKIDPSLIKELPVSPLDRALVQSVVEVARVTGRHTVAKAVENDAILDGVRELGVDFAQGYGVSRPRPLEFLKSSSRVSRSA